MPSCRPTDLGPLLQDRDPVVESPRRSTARRRKAARRPLASRSTTCGLRPVDGDHEPGQPAARAQIDHAGLVRAGPPTRRRAMAANPSAWRSWRLERTGPEEAGGTGLGEDARAARRGSGLPSSAPGTGAGVSPPAR